MRQVFERIYVRNDWGHGSGEGSLPVHTRPYVKFLQQFLHRQRIKSVVDFGCGDWQFSKSIRWDDIEYRGYDIVPAIVSANRQRYQEKKISFHEIGGDFADLPAADLLIVKDVLQHWSDETIRDFLPVLSRYPLALITNCVNPAGVTENLAIADGGFRYLDVRLPPFLVKAKDVLSFSNYRPSVKRLIEKPRWVKKVLLVNS
ncbi:MAG TPA: methyltransferase [Rhizomicrobium sp.]|jgi:SAM-dependent methyltransferase|nr:methyltransferase [Rhizomicrobium sp.]